MRHEYAELIGIAAAAASLYAAHARTMIPLRIAAIVANALAMSYSFLHGTYPTFALNAILLPINAWRLHAMLGLVRELDRAIKSDMSADWLLPYARPKTFRAGDIMMARGDYATAAFYIVAGEVDIPEHADEYGHGAAVLVAENLLDRALVDGRHRSVSPRFPLGTGAPRPARRRPRWPGRPRPARRRDPRP